MKTDDCGEEAKITWMRAATRLRAASRWAVDHLFCGIHFDV
jgi:hypothetical protein